ncbi:MAG: hypothetical protein ACRDS9_03370 [Pseudonocardiaceae bacterium]
MTTTTQSVLVLGGTGKTGSRVTGRLVERGVSSRTAARNGAGVSFDWDDPSTYSHALTGVDRIYLVTPFIQRSDFADRVSRFLDLAEVRGVRHVTYLSAYGIDQAPPEIALRAVELNLMGRGTFTHSILRPAWFMQNFSEAHLKPVDGLITVPTGNGAEAFVDAADIIARVTNQPIKHHDVDQEVWIRASVAAGVPADYGDMLRLLTETSPPVTAPGPTTTFRPSPAWRRPASPTSPRAPYKRGCRRRSDDHDERFQRLQGAGPVFSDHRGGCTPHQPVV